MDWVKVYTIIIITLAVALNIAKHGDTKSGKVDWYDGILGCILMLPVYGRVFGFW